jgi:hypothetical protein
MKNLAKTCLFLILPLSVVGACGSSGDSGNTGHAGASGGTGATAGSLNNHGGDFLDLGGDGPGTGTGGTTMTGTGGTLSGAGTTNTFGGVTATGDTACSNGKDDDGDGLIDGFDPECTGPWDNDESTFATGISGDNKDPKWQDCFFDGNSGAGDDGCRYATGCLTGDVPQDDKDCTLTDACIEFCAPFTPNGCDCFGCCTVAIPGGSVDIMAAGSCSVDQVDDVDACPRCVKSDACGNTCGRCELCPGKTEADLPEDCAPTGAGGAPSGTGGANTGGGPSYSCDGGEQVCGPGLPGCALTTYCSQGCCIAQPPK